MNQSTAQSSNKIDICLEIGAKLTVASAIEWPGWCHSGRDEASALKALCDYGLRYARVLAPKKLGFIAPTEESEFNLLERLEGNSTTDMGVPAITPSSDKKPVDDAALHHFQALLELYWQAFGEAVSMATGKELRKGPRGGGRSLEGIVRHVIGADEVYLEQLGSKYKIDEKVNLDEALVRMRHAILNALQAATHGELPTVGPRGGIRWTPRYFVRRAGYHVLDHAWEIEDRVPL